MNKEIHEKLEKTVGLVNKVLIDPNIDLSYCIPDVAMTVKNPNVSGDPYIHLKYMVSGLHLEEQNIVIKKNYLKKTPEDLANLITFYIEQFIENISTVEYGSL